MLAIRELIRRRGDDSLELAIDRATTITLSNAEELGEDIALFPNANRGIAQGNCLSPILGNVLLTGFDELMNADGVVCLRFIDDFILLSKSESALHRRMDAGKAFLSTFGLDAYVPGDGSAKADQGKTTDKFTFLGCQVHYPRIIPDVSSRLRLLQKINRSFEESIGDMRSLRKGVRWQVRRRSSVVSTLSHVSDIVKAWAGAYGDYCDTELIYPEIDTEIDKMLRSYLGQYTALRKKLSGRHSRDILGIPRLSDL
jgi:hypothetical protein